MRDCRLVFVEGVMGSGKSTTASFVARQVRRNGVPARYIAEGGTGNAVRMMSDLPHPFAPWRDLTTDEYRERSLAKWRAFVAAAGRADGVSVFDGQLFHGNMTDLLLMDAGRDALRAYVGEVVAAVRECNPMLVYLYQADVGPALRRVFAERGRRWEKYQVKWKVSSPYARQRRLAGLAGLIAIYREYRDVTDELFALLALPRLAIENSAGDWPQYRRAILAFLGLPLVDDADVGWLPERGAGSQ